MPTLHILSNSPFADDRLQSCLSLLSDGDGLLLCGEAVQALRSGTALFAALDDLAKRAALHALAEDLAARGLAPPAWVRSVDYPEFVELCCRYARTNTWL